MSQRTLWTIFQQNPQLEEIFLSNGCRVCSSGYVREEPVVREPTVLHSAMVYFFLSKGVHHRLMHQEVDILHIVISLVLALGCFLGIARVNTLENAQASAWTQEFSHGRRQEEEDVVPERWQGQLKFPQSLISCQIFGCLGGALPCEDVNTNASRLRAMALTFFFSFIL